MALPWWQTRQALLSGDLGLLEKERRRLELTLKNTQVGLATMIGLSFAFALVLDIPLDLVISVGIAVFLVSSYGVIINLSKVTRKELEATWEEIRTLKMSAPATEGPTTRPFGTHAHPPGAKAD